MKAVGGLERELSNSLPYRLSIRLQYQAVRKGQNWSAISSALRNWIITGASLLEDRDHVLDRIPGVPFLLYVEKDSSRRPGVIFARSDPGDHTLSDRIREQLLGKANKLLKYQMTGKTMLLLVESEDIALMNELKMLAAIWKAFSGGLPPGVDQVWYADTSIPREICFKDFTLALKR
jgi:hypothetical protein